MAAELNDNSAVIAALIDGGADPNVRDEVGCPPSAPMGQIELDCVTEFFWLIVVTEGNGMGASHPLMFEGRKGWTLAGRRHQSATW